MNQSKNIITGNICNADQLRTDSDGGRKATSEIRLFLFDCMFVLLALLSCVSVRSLNHERLLIISEWV